MLLLLSVELCVAIVFLQRVSASSLVLGEFGYENVIINIQADATVDYGPEKCQQIINSIKGYLSSGSKSVCSVTQSRASINSVIISIPQSWNSICPPTDTVPWVRSRLADIEIGKPHPISRNNPITFQYGGCGDSGKPIYVPVEYLMNNSNSKLGTQFVHEWAHYRYGVFDERGILGDLFYPSGFSIAGKGFEPNSCTDRPMTGSWNGSGTCGTESNPDCNWVTVPEDNTAVKSSLMYTTDLPEVEEFCNHGNHKKESPNKQNFYCEGRSVLDVVFSHKDFTTRTSVDCNVEPSFTLVTNPFKGFLVILDRTSAMANSPCESCFTYAVESLKQFIWHLPEGIVLNLLTYGSQKVEWIQNRTVINDQTKEYIIHNLNLIQEPSPSTEVANALEQALTGALDFHSEGLDYVLLTATNAVPSIAIASLSAKYREKNIPMHVINFGLNTANGIQNFTFNGLFSSVPFEATDEGDSENVGRGPMTYTVANLVNIFSSTVQLCMKIYEKGHRFAGSLTKQGFFIADCAGDELLVIFTSSSPDLRIQLSDSSKNYTVIPINGTRFWKTEEQITNFTMAEFAYTITTFDPEALVFVDVWVENPSQEDAVIIQAWVNTVDNNPINLNSGPPTIHAKLTRNRKPVKFSGLITAKVYSERRTSKIELLDTVSLNDLGEGPDVTGGDGIYSGYATKLSGKKRRYIVVVEANNYFNPSYVCEDYVADEYPLAGSQLTRRNCDTEITIGSRYVYGVDFQVTTMYNTDILPPERIRDLKITSWDSGTMSGRLQWTAPRDNYGIDSQIKSFAISMQIGTENDTEVYRGTLPLEDGSVSYEVQVPSAVSDAMVMFRVKSFDAWNNTSSYSNTATVYVPSSSTDTTTTTPTTLNASSTNGSSRPSTSTTDPGGPTTTGPITEAPPGPSYGIPYGVFWPILCGFIITSIVLIVTCICWCYGLEIKITRKSEELCSTRTQLSRDHSSKSDIAPTAIVTVHGFKIDDAYTFA